MHKFIQLTMVSLIIVLTLNIGNASATSYQVVSDDNYPPLSFWDRNRKPVGYDHDVMKLVQTKTGLEFETILMDWNQAKQAVKMGSADILLGVSQSPGRENDYDFSIPFLENKVVIFVPKENFSISRPEDLFARRIGVQHGDVAQEYLLRNYTNLHLYTYNNQVEALEDLRLGKIDAVAGNYYTGIYLISKNKWENHLKVVGTPLLTMPHCIAVQKGNTVLLDRINNALKDALEQGEIQKIQDRWFGENYFLGFALSAKYAKYIVYLFAFVVLIVVLGSIFIYSLRHQVEKATEQLTEANSQLAQAYEVTIRAFLKALEHRESQTAVHSIRVNRLAMAIGRELNLPRKEMAQLNWGTLLHDIGKLSINDAVLLKPGALTTEEYEKIKRHPAIGHEILQDSVYLKDSADVILYHHEKFDGTGYPFGLKQEQIPRAARICAVADAFEAMIADRPYRKGRPIEDALAEIIRCSGTQFDPQIVEVFVALAAKNDFSAILYNGKQQN